MFFLFTEITLRNLQSEIESGTIVDNRRQNPFEIPVSFEGGPIGVTGENLWKLTAYGSQSAEGTGTKYNQQAQVLNKAQRDSTLIPSDPVDFGTIGFNVDMSELSCSTVRYLCLRLTKNEGASVDFTVLPSEGLVNCMPLKCDGT